MKTIEYNIHELLSYNYNLFFTHEQYIIIEFT